MMKKCESEILFDLMKRDGDVTPSDVLPYESELKEKYLNQVVGAYPKLQDYRAEWLNYNLYYQLPSDFPIESVANVTSASFYNVVPDGYRSAILKGSTKYCDIDTGEVLDAFEDGRNLELVSVKMPVLCTTGKNLFDLELVQGGHGYGEVGKKPNFNMSTTRVTNVTGNYIKINPNTKITFSISNDIIFSIAELDINGYGLGDTGWVIKSSHTITTKEKTSYIGFNFRKFDNSIITPQEVFDGNPMLEIIDTVTTYEPFKSIILTVNEDVTLRGVGDVKDELNLLTGELTQRIGENNEVLAQEVVKTVDLRCINEQGESVKFRPIEGTMHVSTSSQTLPPLLDMSVPIEATSQNLMSFANIEEEE